MHQPTAYAVFHLNLAFSAIPVEKRPEVVARCYRPLLDLVEAGYPLGIEATGWTLERIAEIDSAWIDRFRGLLEAGACELVGSGHVQTIGPLSPSSVNRWNQQIGMDTYERLLGLRPQVVLVNEMAFSSSLVDLYSETGYGVLVMDRDNVRLALDQDEAPIQEAPTHAVGSGGAELRLLWADSILFQKLQQAAHGDITEGNYLEYLRRRIEGGEGLLPLYANDAEVFDFRPGRFEAEARLHPEGEWRRVQRLFAAASDDLGAGWALPSLAAATDERRPSRLVSASYPIPVKKQAKYNLARWAVSGRNDTWINSMAHRLAAALPETEMAADETMWRGVCELWGTDLRTHITEDRWLDAERDVVELAEALSVGLSFGSSGQSLSGSEQPPETGGFQIVADPEGIDLTVTTPAVQLSLSRRRGLTIQTLGFASHGFEPVVGTLPHGYFSSIALGADFYSGGVVAELTEEHRRITDLDWMAPRFSSSDGMLVIQGALDTPLGPLIKDLTVPVDEEWIELGYTFPGWTRPRGTIRAGTITLLPEAFDGELAFSCRNGGDDPESFSLDGPVDHGAATSALISSTSGLGASDGRIEIGDGSRALALSWDPAECAAFPMIKHQPAHPGAFTRVLFSLLELDDTLKPGGPVGSFRLRVGSTP